MNIIFAGRNAEKTAETLFPEAMIIDAKCHREIDADCDVIGFVITLASGALPISIVKYIDSIIKERDNRNVGYIFAVFINLENTRSWAPDWLSSLLAKRGCILSYYAFFKDEEKDRMGEEIKKEEYRLSGNGLFCRLFKRKIQTYND